MSDRDTVATEPAPTGAVAAVAKPPPASLGRYRLTRRLGAGAMGEVWEADDPELARRVAVKLLRRGVTTGRDRLQREARAMARLAHPNVIAIHDVGEADGQLFLAMELLGGGTLGHWLETPRGWREVVRVFVDAGRGLVAAHGAGLVHRDFKPDNVLLGADGRVVVSDLGLARIDAAPDDESDASAGAARDHAVTQTGTVMGTPAYMAPEQHLGRPASAAADQFAFCVALWEALYRQRPFAVGDGDDTLTGALALSVVHGRVRPPPPGVRVPGWLRKALLRGLRVEADERHPSMAALVATLERGLARRRRIATGAAVIAVIVAAAVLATWPRAAAAPSCDASHQLDGVWDAARRDQVRGAMLAAGAPYAAATADRVIATLDDYASRWSAMRLEACRATRIEGRQSAELLDLRDACLDRRRADLDALAGALGAADGAPLDRAIDAAGQLDDLSGCADVTALRAVVPPPADPARRDQAVAAETRLAGARALFELGRYREARVVATAILPEARALDVAQLTGEILWLRGRLENRLGEMSAARATLEEAGPLAADARDDGLAASIGVDLLSAVLGNQGDDDATQKLRPLIDALVRRAGDPPGPRMDLLYIDAALDMDAGDLDAAAAHYHQLLDLAVKSGDDAHQIASLGALAMVAMLHGQWDEASRLGAQQEALAVTRWGADHPSVADVVHQRGVELTNVGRFADAEPLIRRAIDIRTRALGPDDPGVDKYLWSLAMNERENGDLATGLAGFRALADRARRLGDDSNLARALLGAGDIEEDQGDHRAGDADRSEALAIRARTVGSDTIDYAMDEFNLANSEANVGECARAMPRLDDVLAVLARHHAQPSYRAYPLAARATCALVAGDGAAARAAAAQATAACAEAANELQLEDHADASSRGCAANLAAEIAMSAAKARWLQGDRDPAPLQAAAAAMVAAGETSATADLRAWMRAHAR